MGRTPWRETGMRSVRGRGTSLVTTGAPVVEAMPDTYLHHPLALLIPPD